MNAPYRDWDSANITLYSDALGEPNEFLNPWDKQSNTKDTEATEEEQNLEQGFDGLDG
jgi:hypothetical protein